MLLSRSVSIVLYGFTAKYQKKRYPLWKLQTQFLQLTFKLQIMNYVAQFLAGVWVHSCENKKKNCLQILLTYMKSLPPSVKS